MAEDELVLSEAAQRIGVSSAALRQAIERGRLPARRVGPLWVVTTADIDAYAASKWTTGPRNAEWWQKRRPAAPHTPEDA